ncbi:MAG TPA: hypothetical protein C5S51_12905 [Methanosarcinaceae archaeon]|nr:hypothetical protein [Methanosarcinaceae archaeon]
MVSLFKKEDKGKKKTISESEKSEVEKEAYKLGFEVGYHKHSEIGWVSERFSHLDKFASERGLEEFVKVHYERGRDDGVKSKERDIHTGLSKKGIEKEDERAEVSKERVVHEKPEQVFEPGFKGTRTIDDHNYSPTQQPTMTDIPQVTSVTKSISRPTLVDGFKPLKPRR